MNPAKVLHPGKPSRKNPVLWICDWSIRFERGSFTLQAGHVLEAKQTAKKIVRERAAGAPFTFEVTQAGLIARACETLKPPASGPADRN